MVMEKLIRHLAPVHIQSRAHWVRMEQLFLVELQLVKFQIIQAQEHIAKLIIKFKADPLPILYLVVELQI